MSILDKLPFELKNVVLEYARPAYLNDILKIFETNKYNVLSVGNFEVIYKDIPLGKNNLESYNNIYEYFQNTTYMDYTHTEVLLSDYLSRNKCETETELIFHIEDLFIELPTMKKMKLSRQTKNISVINTNNILYIMYIVNDKVGLDVDLNVCDDLLDHTIDLGVILLHKILLELDLYQYMDNNYKLDNIYACQMTCECDFPQSEFLSESHIQLEKITDDQLKSIMRYYMKHY